MTETGNNQVLINKSEEMENYLWFIYTRETHTKVKKVRILSTGECSFPNM